MAIITKLKISDKLPLTCSRSGTCCHGKMVWLNPWELHCLALEKGISKKEFRDKYCEASGIRLSFDGDPDAGWKGLPACSQYDPGYGCSVHKGRPLACRLFPLGRQLQSGSQDYMYEGDLFPCLDGCSEVEELPQLTVEEYIDGQGAKSKEVAQDLYLELMQDIADGAFALLLESGLAESGDRKTLRLWKKIGMETPEQLAARISSDWKDRLMLPNLSIDIDTPEDFCKKHHSIIQSEAQNSFGKLSSADEFHNASVMMMTLALYLGRSLGAEPLELSKHWIKTAKEHGALD